MQRTYTLLLDIGNSRLKSALLDGELLSGGTELPRADLDAASLAAAFGGVSRPDSVLAANVAGDSAAAVVSAWCREQWSLIARFPQVQARYRGLLTEYADPSQLGVDRWLAVLAAWQGRRPACVVGCGTALTVDVLTGDGRFIGGYIIPGLQMMKKLLADGTSNIGTHDLEPPSDAPGRSTSECVSNGAGLAAAALVERVLATMRKDHGAATRCIITGGGADRIAAWLRVEFEVDPQLVLKGLAIVAQERES